LLLVAAVATAEDAPLQTWDGADGQVHLELPAGWDVRLGVPRDSLMTMSILVPESGAEAALTVYRLPGMLGARSQAYYERAERKVEGETTLSSKVALDPLPHLVERYRDEEKVRVRAFAYRVIRHNGVSVSLGCDEEHWPELRSAFLAAARTLKADLPQWPPRPPGYREEIRDGYLYQIHPHTKPGQIRTFHRLLLKREKRYAQKWGPVPKTADRRPIIVFSPSRSDTRRIKGATGKLDYESDLLGGRIFAVPLDRGDPAQRGLAAAAMADLFHLQVHGSRNPLWLLAGERTLALSEAYTGKKIPYLPRRTRDALQRPGVTFRELLSWEGDTDRWEEYARISAAYVALFRGGPRRCRKAFAGFRAELLENGDWEAAATKHILALDQDELVRELDRYTSRNLKVAKSRR